MSLQIVTIDSQDFQNIITDAYREGYLKAQREWAIEKAAQKEEPKFGEIIRGCKELWKYLTYKGYWSGSLNTLSKTAPQLLSEGDKQGFCLIFRRGCIDHAFETGFRFLTPQKSQVKK
jgi:hypothetical protein